MQLDIEHIKNLIPQRYPFIMIDRILDIEPGKRATALKNVSGNEEFFQGHFPENPIMPGALILEAIEEPLLVFRLLVLLHRLVHQSLGELLEPGVGGEAEGVGEAVLLADLVHPGQAEAGVAADVDGDVGPLLAQGMDHAHQVVLGAQ